MAAAVVSKYVNPQQPGRVIYHANDDNVQGEFRALTEEDIFLILEEHAWSLGCAVDTCSKYQCYRDDPKSAVPILLNVYPDIQRSMVWRGSSLRWEAVTKLREGRSLTKACAVVIRETISCYTAESLEAAIREQLTPFSYFLRRAVIS